MEVGVPRGRAGLALDEDEVVGRTVLVDDMVAVTESGVLTVGSDVSEGEVRGTVVSKSPDVVSSSTIAKHSEC